MFASPSFGCCMKYAACRFIQMCFRFAHIAKYMLLGKKYRNGCYQKNLGAPKVFIKSIRIPFGPWLKASCLRPDTRIRKWIQHLDAEILYKHLWHWDWVQRPILNKELRLSLSLKFWACPFSADSNHNTLFRHIHEYNIPMTRHSKCVCVFAVDDREKNNKKKGLKLGWQPLLTWILRDMHLLTKV